MRLFLWVLALFLVSAAAGQPLEVGHSLNGPLDPDEEIALILNRALTPEDGRIAVFVGSTDLSALVEYDGSTLRYRPALLSLPAGASELTVYLVSAGEPWRELARMPLQVRLPAGFDKARLDPDVTLNNKGQLAESTFPAQEAEHRIYQDFSGQMLMRAELEHSGWSLVAQGQMVGASYQNEALRFGELQHKAPKVDLASYDVTLRRQALSIQAGHISYGRHRHLNNYFSSRGLTASANFRGVLDASVAAMNGSRVVGWSNVLGLSEPEHRILSGTVGLNVLRERIRLEGSYVDGSLLPQTGFNQGGIPDAEKSHGGGIRLSASTKGQRLRLEAGYAGSRYTNPLDPLLAQGDPIVRVREETRYAHFAEATAVLLQNAMLSPSLPVNLQAVYRRERVDPLYRTVAAFVQADKLHNGFDLQGSIGAVSLQMSLSRSEDNLDHIPSILKTISRRRSLNAGIPLPSLFKGSSFLPVATYGYDETSQVAAAMPVNGGFSPTHLPDQMNRIHHAALTWQGSRWSLQYQFSSALQDNRQEGRENADFLHRSNGLAFSVDPRSWLGLGIDAGLDEAKSKEDDQVTVTSRIGLRSTLRPIRALTVSAGAAPTLTRNEQSRTRNVDLSFEGAYAFQLSTTWPARGQVFLRYVRREARYRDFLFLIDSENRIWSVNTGVTLTLF